MNAGGGIGLPVIVSEAALGNTIAMDPAGIFVADDGVAIAASEQAMIQMNDAPDNPTLATTVFTSLWQDNLTGFKSNGSSIGRSTTGAVRYLAGA